MNHRSPAASADSVLGVTGSGPCLPQGGTDDPVGGTGLNGPHVGGPPLVLPIDSCFDLPDLDATSIPRWDIATDPSCNRAGACSTAFAALMVVAVPARS